MCELTLVNMKDRDLNKTWVKIQAIINSKNNQDGFGLFSNGKLWKTDKPANNLIFSNILEKIVDENPILVHVRKSSNYSYSFSTKDKTVIKKVTKEHSHPFESQSFILAHNGTLRAFAGTRANSLEITNKEKIDTQIFLIRLEEEYQKSRNFIKAINSAMSEFYGKFAFLVFSKDENKFYVVKGATADLYLAEIGNGFLINTEFTSLKTSIALYLNLVGLDTIKRIIPIKEESIYEVTEGGLNKVGTVKENFQKIDLSKYENCYKWDYDKGKKEKIDTEKSLQKFVKFSERRNK